MKKILSIFLVLAIVFTLAACSGKTVDYTGTYDVIRIDAGEASASEEDLATLRELGYEAIMSFASDGTGLMSIAGNESDFTYDAKTGAITMEGGVSKMEFNDEGQLVISDDGGAMYLEKRAEE